jgi:RNA polymerase sigma factor (sigma-70 family)
VAWAEFVRRFSPLIDFAIKKALSLYAGNPGEEDAKDVRQNLMISLWSRNKLEEIKNRENINYWLAVTARNASLNYLRTKNKDLLIGEESYFEQFSAKDIPATGNENHEKKVEAIYNLLKPREKLVFTLYFRKKFNLNDISKILNIPSGSASSIITRMKKKIIKNS